MLLTVSKYDWYPIKNQYSSKIRKIKLSLKLDILQQVLDKIISLTFYFLLKKRIHFPLPHIKRCSYEKMIQTYLICGKPAIFYNSLFSNKVTPEIHCFSKKNKFNTARRFRLSYLMIYDSKPHKGPS